MLRGGTVVGSAQATIASGDVAFEVNHPGGVCWGAGTGLAVTPDIVAGDLVQIKIGGAVIADTLVQDAAVNADSVLSGSQLTVKGIVARTVNPAFVEQRIINPDLVGTEVARRDIRAVPGPLTRAAKGGYASSLTISASGAALKNEFAPSRNKSRRVFC